MASERRKQKTKSAVISSYDALPTSEGPKLARFKDSRADIQFVDLLSSETPGADGQVFEVIIKSKRYALKMAGETTPHFISRH